MSIFQISAVKSIGLDSRSASIVLRAIRRIARSGRTCIVTIHQPAAELFFMFDSLILMAPGGHLVFSGELGFRCREFVKYFSSIPGILPIPLLSNPSNWMLDQSSKDQLIPKFEQTYAGMLKQVITDLNISLDDWENNLKTNQKWIQFLKWYYINYCPDYKRIKQELKSLESVYYASIGMEPPQGFDEIEQNKEDQIEISDNQPEQPPTTNTATGDSTLPNSKHSTQLQHEQQKHITNKRNTPQIDFTQQLEPPKPPSILRQIAVMTGRQWYVYYRNPSAILNRTFVVLLSSFLNGFIYYQTKPVDTATLLSYCAAVVISTATSGMSIGSGSLAGYLELKPVFYREIRGFYTSTSVWAFGVLLNELLWALPFAILQTIPIYFLVGINHNHNAGDFFHYIFTTYTTIIVYVSAMSAFSAISPSVPVAQMLAGLLGGLGFAVNGIAVTLAQLRKISGFHQALFYIFPLGPANFKFGTFLFNTEFARTHMVSVIVDNVVTTMSLKDYAAQYFGWSYDLGWLYWGILMIQIVFWQTVYHLGLRFLNFTKR